MVAYLLTDSLIVAAVAATIGANIGYYATNYLRAHRAYLFTRRSSSISRGYDHLWAMGYAVRSILIEFGPGEIADSVIVRPGLYAAVPMVIASLGLAAGSMTGIGVGWVLAKVAADVVFYVCTILSFEANRSRVADYGDGAESVGES